MKPFYNTPQLRNDPPSKPPRKTGKDLVIHLEDKISNYLDDCNKGYCTLDNKVLVGLREELASACSSEYASRHHPVCQIDETWFNKIQK